MDYSNISSFLEKFKKIVFKDEELRNAIAISVLNETKHSIDSNKIKIKNGVVYLKVSPIFLNEIMMRKNKILSNIESILPNSKILDIR